MIETKQINFLEMEQVKEKYAKKAKQKSLEYQKRAKEIDEEYKDIMGEYHKKAAEIQAIVDAFNLEWEPKLSERTKELKKLEKQYKKERKTIKDELNRELGKFS